MEINGTIFKILPQQEVAFGDGTSKVKGGFVIMREGEYPKPVAFELFGEDRLAMLNGLNIGVPVRVNFYAESREGKDGKFYTTLRCTNLMPFVPGMMPPAPVTPAPDTTYPVYGQWNPQPGTPVAQNQPPTAIPPENDLPFDDDQTPF